MISMRWYQFILVAIVTVHGDMAANDICHTCECSLDIIICRSKILDKPCTLSGLYEKYSLQIRDSEVGLESIRELRTQLRDLRVVSSSLTNVSDTFFYDFVELVSIKISDTGLQDLSPKMFLRNKQLTDVDLSKNQIDDLPSVLFYQLLELSRVRLQENNLRRILKNTFAFNRKIKLLDLSSNRIQEIEVGAFNISEASSVSTDNLRVMNVSSNALWEIRNNTFSSCQELTHLDMSNNKISRLSFDSFSGLRNLRELMLRNNSLRYVSSITLHPLTSLVLLDLHDNMLSEVSGNMFANSPSLVRLFLSRNKIEHVSTDSFQGMSSLEELFLDDNSLKDLGPVFKKPLPNLLNLRLGRNRITSVPKETFNGFKKLRQLDLSDNLISDIENGAFYSNSRLRELQLQRNSLERLHCGSFSKLSSLRFLNMNGNSFKEFRLDTFLQLRNLSHLSLGLNRSCVCDCSLFKTMKRLNVVLYIENIGDVFGECNLLYQQFVANDTALWRGCNQVSDHSTCKWNVETSASSASGESKAYGGAGASAVWYILVYLVIVFLCAGFILVMGDHCLKKRRLFRCIWGKNQKDIHEERDAMFWVDEEEYQEELKK